MATTEDIEARLAAYIDGALDAAGRAEIERHLASNPQHRGLIEELMQQRDMLRALPRARAPGDIADNINAHLERAALLGDDDAAAIDQPILRIGHWSQLRAVAAVLLLVFSLAAVVYYVISSPKTNDEFARSIETAPTAGDSLRAAAPTTGASDADADIAPRVLVGSGTPDTERRTSSTIQEQRARDALTESIGVVRRPSQDPASSADAGARAKLDDAPITLDNSGAKQIVVEIVSSDPFAAQRHLTEYLVQNNIEYKPAEDAPEPLRLQASNLAHASRLQQTRVQMKSAPATAAPAAEAQSDNERLYLAGRLSRSQVDQLSLDMNTKLGQRAQVIETPAPVDPGRSRADTPSEPGDIFSPPATQPAAVADELDRHAEAREVQPTTQPGTQRQLTNVFAADAPATAGPAEAEQVDVVIVVRSPDPAEGGSEPAEAPATQPQDEADSEPPSTAPTTAPAESDD
jgi:hypothetical protein